MVVGWGRFGGCLNFDFWDLGILRIGVSGDCQNQDGGPRIEYGVTLLEDFQDWGGWMVTLNGTGVRVVGARGRCHQIFGRWIRIEGWASVLESCHDDA